jgi:hypothetical protein
MFSEANFRALDCIENLAERQKILLSGRRGPKAADEHTGQSPYFFYIEREAAADTRRVVYGAVAAKLNR